MIIPIKIDGQKHNLKTEWTDLTLEEFYKVMEWASNPDNDPMLFYSYIIDADVKFLENVSEMSFKSVVDSSISDFTTPFDLKKWKRTYKYPKEVTIGDRVLPTPKSLDIKKFGQLLTCETEFSKINMDERLSPWEKEYQRAKIAIAIMMNQELTGDEKFNVDKSFEYLDDIGNMKATEGYSVAVFFWKRFYELQGYDRVGLRQKLTSIKNAPGLKSLLSMVVSLLWTRSPKVTSRNTMQS